MLEITSSGLLVHVQAVVRRLAEGRQQLAEGGVPLSAFGGSTRLDLKPICEGAGRTALSSVVTYEGALPMASIMDDASGDAVCGSCRFSIVSCRSSEAT